MQMLYMSPVKRNQYQRSLIDPVYWVCNDKDNQFTVVFVVVAFTSLLLLLVTFLCLRANP